jgi:DNA repair exonuclease SbcCD ATPase subunit
MIKTSKGDKMAVHRAINKINIFVLLCLIFNLTSGCGKPYIESEKTKTPNRDEKKLLKRHQEITDELKILKDKMDEVTGQIYTLTTKEKYGSKMTSEPMENKEENKVKLDALKIEAKDLQKKYDPLAGEIKEIEQKLKDLGYPIEKPASLPNENAVPVNTK